MPIECKERDRLILELWIVFRKMSDEIDPEEFTDEDLELWGVVTKHSTVQKRLEGMA